MSAGNLAEMRAALYRRALRAFACWALLCARTACGATDYEYPKCPSLASVKAGDEPRQVIARVARELAADPLARQFSADRQTAVDKAARRLVLSRQFEARFDDLAKRIEQGQVPSECLPERYVSTDGLLAKGREKADKILEGFVADYWLAQCGVSSLEMKLWGDLMAENPSPSRSAGSFVKSKMQTAAQKVVVDFRRRPYQQIEQAVKNCRVEVQTGDTAQAAMQRAVEQVLQAAGVTASAEFAMFARVKLCPVVLEAYEAREAQQDKVRETVLKMLRQASGGDPANEQVVAAAFAALEADRRALAAAVQIDETIARLLGDPKTAIQQPCAWHSQDRDRLLLAAALMCETDSSARGYNDSNLGRSLVASMGLSESEKQSLHDCFPREAALVNAETQADRFMRKEESVRTARESLQKSLAQPGGFRLLAERDASRQWSQRTASSLRDKLSKSLIGSSANRAALLEEATHALARQLDEVWRIEAVEHVRTRRVRVAMLSAADLGSLDRFRTFTAWPLAERIRCAIEDVLRREGWTDECLENYFISQALDARAQQLARMVAQVYGSS